MDLVDQLLTFLLQTQNFKNYAIRQEKDKSIMLYKPVIRLYSPDIRLHNSSVSVKKWIHIRQYHLNHCKQRLLRTSVVNNNIVNLHKSQHRMYLFNESMLAQIRVFFFDIALNVCSLLEDLKDESVN